MFSKLICYKEMLVLILKELKYLNTVLKEAGKKPCSVLATGRQCLFNFLLIYIRSSKLKTCQVGKLVQHPEHIETPHQSYQEVISPSCNSSALVLLKIALFTKKSEYFALNEKKQFFALCHINNLYGTCGHSLCYQKHFSQKYISIGNPKFHTGMSIL